MEASDASQDLQDLQDFSDLNEVEKNLINHRGYLLALNKVLEWDPAYVPGVVIFIVTLTFSILWYVEPTVLTVVSLGCILACILDHVAPIVSNQFYRQPEHWTETEEVQYKRVCERLLNGKTHVKSLWDKLFKLKADKPNTFVLTVVGTFLTLAWIGTLIDTLLLIYLIVVLATLVPGLRKHGMMDKAGDFVKSKLKKKSQ